MILFPAIDIRGGKCVRLIQGDYAQEVVYGDSPVEMALLFEKQGAEFLHIVDLDGAKSGATLNEIAIQEIAAAVSIPIQVGGGIRTIETVQKLINAGVSRVIIGTAAITNEAFLKKAVQKYGAKIAVSIDARNGYVATDGWTETSEKKALDVVKQLEEIGLSTLVYTDIFKDGMLEGPNFEELAVIQRATSIDVIASGGVTSEADLARLEGMQLYGAIIGKALYEGKLSLEKLQAGASNEA